MGIVHSCVLNVLPNVEIVAVCEKSGMIRRFSKKIFKGMSILDDVSKLADLDLDAAFVTTPIPSHFSVTKALYANNVVRNVFVEKTLADNFEQASELTKLASKSGGVNMVGYLRRFYVTFRKARELLLQKAIGVPSSFEGYAYSADFCDGRGVSDVLVSRGGILRDLGCYAIDLSLWFFGELHLSQEKTSVRGDHNDSVTFEVEGSSGLVGCLEASPFMPDYRMPEIGFLIKGSEGEIVVNDDRVELRPVEGKGSTWYRHDLDDSVPFCLGLPEYYREDALFVESVVKKQAAEPDFNMAARVDDLIWQIERGGRNG
jgi:predicted dehydrogenase